MKEVKNQLKGRLRNEDTIKLLKDDIAEMIEISNKLSEASEMKTVNNSKNSSKMKTVKIVKLIDLGSTFIEGFDKQVKQIEKYDFDYDIIKAEYMRFVVLCATMRMVDSYQLEVNNEKFIVLNLINKDDDPNQFKFDNNQPYTAKGTGSVMNRTFIFKADGTPLQESDDEEDYDNPACFRDPKKIFKKINSGKGMKTSNGGIHNINEATFTIK